MQHPSGEGGAAATFDVAVVGGGPAGAATCLRLAGSGLRVGLFERSHFQAPRVGVVLAPAVDELLQRLGVGADVEHAGFLRCHGVCSIWGSHRVGFRDFMFAPHGWGWQVERPAAPTSTLVPWCGPASRPRAMGGV